MMLTIKGPPQWSPSRYSQSHDCAQSSLASYLSGCGSVSQNRRHSSVSLPATKPITTSPSSKHMVCLSVSGRVCSGNGSVMRESATPNWYLSAHLCFTIVVIACLTPLQKRSWIYSVYILHKCKLFITRKCGGLWEFNRDLSLFHFLSHCVLIFAILIQSTGTTIALRCSLTMICWPSMGPRLLKVTKPAFVWRTHTALTVRQINATSIWLFKKIWKQEQIRDQQQNQENVKVQSLHPIISILKLVADCKIRGQASCLVRDCIASSDWAALFRNVIIK